jgi:hypothetical protein
MRPSIPATDRSRSLICTGQGSGGVGLVDGAQGGLPVGEAVWAIDPGRQEVGDVGGVRYLAAGGDPGEVQKAKTMFKAAAVGYAIAALAPALVGILRSVVGA